MKKVIIARMTVDGKAYIGKREVTLHDANSQISDVLVSEAIVGQTLRVQRQIREALKVKNGLKTVSTAGETTDLSNIEDC